MDDPRIKGDSDMARAGIGDRGRVFEAQCNEMCIISLFNWNELCDQIISIRRLPMCHRDPQERI